MSTSSDDPADATPAGSSQTAPLPPPIATSPPSSATPSSATPTSATAAGPPLSSAAASVPTLAPTPVPTLAPTLAPTVTDSPTSAPAPAGSAAASRAPFGSRPGDLTPKWRYALVAAWVLAFFAYAAIWQASVQIGIGTWWIGPRAQPTPTLVRVIPSLLTISIAMCAIYNVPRLVRLSAFGVLLAAIVAIPDFSRSVSLGVAELIIAGMLGLVTVAALTGRYRLVPNHTLDDPRSNLERSDAAPDAAPDTARDAATAGYDGVGGSTNSGAAMGSFAAPDQTRR